MKRFSWLLVAVASAALFAGCSASDVKKVKIALTLDGAPLTDAEVTLVPKDDPELGSGGTGRTASDGKVEIVSTAQKPLKPGRYVVLVKKYVRDDGTPFQIEDDIARRSSSKDATFGAKNKVPDAYKDKERALLIVELNSGDNAPPPFDLDSKKK